MIREMLRISLLLAGATVGLTAGHPAAYAQSVLQPTPRANVPLMAPNYGTTASPTTNTYQRLDAAKNATRARRSPEGGNVVPRKRKKN